MDLAYPQSLRRIQGANRSSWISEAFEDAKLGQKESMADDRMGYIVHFQ